MSHEISAVSGKSEMMYVGEKPWHGLGTAVPEAVKSDEAIRLAGLDWDVTQRKLFMPDPDGSSYELGIEIPDRLANIRMGPDGPVYLGTVSKQYKIIQNRDAFKLFDEIVGQKLAIYHTAGALKDGRRVWILAKLPGELVIRKTAKGDDTVEKFLLLANSHDGTFQLRMFWTPIRVVCNNTLTMATQVAGENEGFRFSHVGDNLDERIGEAVKLLQIANKKFLDLETLYQKLATVALKDVEAEDYFRKLLPDEPEMDNRPKQKARDGMMLNYMGGKGAELAVGTLWGAYNGVTEYVDHSRYEKRKVAPEGRMQSLMFGDGWSMKARALSLAQKLVVA